MADLDEDTATNDAIDNLLAKAQPVETARSLDFVRKRFRKLKREKVSDTWR